ncbi:M20/M25/M40 family metallo-hydrolase [Spirosoma sp. HMF4905]|uniref:Vacuolar membrane protease n=1 Tax=Spirosoma arboris TaxID=2682092 RepID=A0A7K1SQC0_9BACT|nr:M28 family peptidase [Spirosoma arboris]MVM35893.1 M20/M25/M40 family metallo-hydrolase [Spirosoma arboris]
MRPPIPDFLPIPTRRLSLLLLLVLLALATWSIYLTNPPQAKPASAPITEFSAGRAMQPLEHIAQEPHAMGTPGHARVRTYLLDALRGLGLEPQVQEATYIEPTIQSGYAGMFSAVTEGAYVYNIMARLKGTQAGKAVLLLAHYDSQPNTLAAADDGAGVAAILETVRAIRQSGPLQHDVIVLLTDGEEYGLFGAKAFLKHPWAKDVELVLNLEARGNSGPSSTFELSSENGWLVEQLAKAAPYPLASSLAYEVYKLLPNSTDFTPLRESGYAGLNSAIADGFANYHKLTDSPQNLNQNSLQHHGENLLALTRHFANGPLNAVKAPDRVFFNGAGFWLIHYPMSLDILWMGLLTLAVGAVLWLGYQQHKLTIGQVLASLVLQLVLLGLLSGLCWGVNMLVQKGIPYWHFFNGTYSSALFSGAFALLTVGAFGGLIGLALRWLRPLSLVAGGFVLVYGLTWAAFLLLPAATYIVLFPLLGVLAGVGIVLWQSRNVVAGADVPTTHSWMVAGWLVAGALPTLFMLLPLIQSLAVIFDLQLPVAPVVLLGLALLLLLPLWLLIEPGLRWRKLATLPIALLVLSIGLMLIAIDREQPSASHPLNNQLSYYQNTDTRQAFWASYYFKTPNDWSKQFFPTPSYGKLTEMYPNGHRNSRNEYLKNPAPLIDVATPIATVLSDKTTDSTRHLTLELRSVRGAAHLEMGLFVPTATDLRTAQINGQPLPLKAEQTAQGPAYDLLFMGLPVSKTIQLTLELRAGSPLRLLLYDQSIGLPAGLIKTPMPAWVIPEQGPRSNLTVLRKTYMF